MGTFPILRIVKIKLDPSSYLRSGIDGESEIPCEKGSGFTLSHWASWVADFGLVQEKNLWEVVRPNDRDVEEAAYVHHVLYKYWEATPLCQAPL